MTRHHGDQSRDASGDLLHDVSLTVAPGAFVGLIGPNGGGKSSLLRCAFRHARPDSGQVLLDDTDIWQASARWSAQHIAVVLQDPPDEFGLSVEEVVTMGRTPHKRLLDGVTQEDLALVEQALDDVDLGDYRHRLFATLSGGERQRTLLARAFVQQPRVLMLDEPTNHLDPRHQIALLRRVKARGVSTLAALHDLNLAAAFCDRLYLLVEGRIVAHGTTRDVLTTERLKQYYGVDALIDDHPVHGHPRITLITE
ncbi:histidinol phosphatase [Robbsia andropogonis]|uniref:Histidinol phosphatase n=1 Tax=Robbsia andropogonis TaxID=28092 RepID=A0A0F5K1H1_9BURK|nr:histidinol phosphatase [Robbsia andropogonis]